MSVATGPEDTLETKSMLLRYKPETLQERLRELGIMETEGNLSKLVHRVHEAQKERWELSYGNKPTRHEARSFVPADNNSRKLSSGAMDWARSLRLSAQSVRELEENGFLAVEQILELREPDLEKVFSLMADRISARNCLFPIKPESSSNDARDHGDLRNSSIRRSKEGDRSGSNDCQRLRESNLDVGNKLKRREGHLTEPDFNLNKSGKSSDDDSICDDVESLEKTLAKLSKKARNYPSRIRS